MSNDWTYMYSMEYPRLVAKDEDVKEMRNGIYQFRHHLYSNVFVWCSPARWESYWKHIVWTPAIKKEQEDYIKRKELHDNNSSK